MEGKLIKVPQGYYLEEVFEPGTRGSAMPQIFASTYGEGYNKLSLTNCQAIERGYDLDELADKYLKKDIYEQDKEILDAKYSAFIDGCKTILEILGDRKFTEEDLKKIIHWSTLDKDVRLSEEELFKSLQRTEWDVVFDTELRDVDEVYVEEKYVNPHHFNNYDSGRVTIKKALQENYSIPKLDEKGRLILKRK